MFVVTGATGLLGNVLVRTLVAQGGGAGARPGPPHLGPQPSRRTGRGVRHGDVHDRDSLVPAFAGADVVFHVAGIVSIARGGFRQLRETNVEGTRNVLSACRRGGSEAPGVLQLHPRVRGPPARRLRHRGEPDRPRPRRRSLRPDQGRSHSGCARSRRAGTRRRHRLSHRRHGPLRLPPVPYRRVGHPVRPGTAEGVCGRGIQLRGRARRGAGHHRGGRQGQDAEKATSSRATT